MKNSKQTTIKYHEYVSLNKVSRIIIRIALSQRDSNEIPRQTLTVIFTTSMQRVKKTVILYLFYVSTSLTVSIRCLPGGGWLPLVGPREIHPVLVVRVKNGFHFICVCHVFYSSISGKYTAYFLGLLPLN